MLFRSQAPQQVQQQAPQQQVPQQVAQQQAPQQQTTSSPEPPAGYRADPGFVEQMPAPSVSIPQSADAPSPAAAQADIAEAPSEGLQRPADSTGNAHEADAGDNDARGEDR